MISGGRREVISKPNQIFRKRPWWEWEEYFDGKEVCCEPVRGIEELFSDPQVIKRRMIVEVDHPLEGRLHQPGNPIKLSEMEETYEAPPGLGQHTEEVLKELGYEPSDIPLLREKGVI